MKKILQLTEEQQQFAAEHHNLVYRFLTALELDERDFYDVVIFGYLLAVQDYLTDRHLPDAYAFSTIAWRKMLDSVSADFRHHNCAMRKVSMGDYHENYASATLDSLLPDRAQAIADMLDNQDLLLKTLSYLTPMETEMVQMKADGYTYQEIGNLWHISGSGISSRFHRMRQRLKTLAFI